MALAPRISTANQGNPPTTEVGTLVGGFATLKGLGPFPWQYFVDADEWVPELIWPSSIWTFDKMRTDTQVSGLYYGCTMPIRRYKWMLDPNGADPKIVEALAADYNLPIKGKQPGPTRRMKNRFSFKDHLRLCLLALMYGHMWFEQVGEIGDGKNFPNDGLWHLKKLVPRMPKTIQDFLMAEDGGLLAIRQNITRQGQFELPLISIDRLLGYVWDKEGADPIGRSMFRDCYKNWLIKDRLLRVDAINHEKAGGVPSVTAAPGSSRGEVEQAQKAASSFRVGESSGVGLPPGAKFSLERAPGSNVMDSVRYHDEAMSRRWLMMILQLGHTMSGSRSLGRVFLELLQGAQDAVADWARDNFNEFMIEDHVDWNWADQEFVPLVVYERPEDPKLAAADLVQMVDKKVISMDKDLENVIRDEYDLPQLKGDRPAPPAPPPAVPPPVPPAGTPPAVPAQARTVQAMTGMELLLPARQLRRNPYEHEVAASVDFSAIDLSWQTQRDQIVNVWRTVQARQIADLHDQIVESEGKAKKLTKISAPVEGVDSLTATMQTIAREGASQAAQEAQRQGVSAAVPEMPEVDAMIAGQAEAVGEMLAMSITDAAVRKSVQLSAGGLTPSEIASEVSIHLASLSDEFLQATLGGALVQAQNAGRFTTMRANGAAEFYASELLDFNTCEPCVARDGTHYIDFVTAAKDYPTGGFKGCNGGPKCRGTLVAIYE